MSSKTATKTTKQMTVAEKQALQERLNALLAQAISDMSQYFDLFEIEPDVRITNNRNRVGSAAVVNSSRIYQRSAALRGAVRKEMWIGCPRFRISISTEVCGNDEELLETIYHEVLHCASNCFNHGTAFKRGAALVYRKLGIKITTRKALRLEGQNGEPIQRSEIRSALREHIGEEFVHKGQTYIFEGFNSRPKKCCDLKLPDGRCAVADVVFTGAGFGIVNY